MAHIDKRKLINGEARWDVEWRNAQGKATSLTFKKKRDAENFITKLDHDRLTGFTVDPDGGKMLVSELAERWLRSDPGKRANTIGRDRSALKAHILPAIGNRQLRGIRQADMQVLVSEWSKTLAPRTVDRTYGTIRAAFAYAVVSGLISRSPCHDVNLPQLVTQKRPVVSPEDVAAVARAMDVRYSAMVWVGALLGLRWGEIAGLRVGSLDLATDSLSITEQVTRDDHGRAVVGPPKSSAGFWTLSMPRALTPILARASCQYGTQPDRQLRIDVRGTGRRTVVLHQLAASHVEASR